MGERLKSICGWYTFPMGNLDPETAWKVSWDERCERCQQRRDCGKPATEKYVYSDGSVLHLCTEHWDEWVTMEEDDLAHYGRASNRGQELLENLARNGVQRLR